MKPKSLLLLSLCFLVLSGCANTTKQYFDIDSPAIHPGKTLAANPDRASVYLMREWALGQGFVPPLFYAVDETMVSTMPVGAYVPLSMEPGVHTFSRFRVVPGGGLARFEVARADVKLELVAGQSYYVSEVNALSNTFRHVAKERGREILDGADLAKFIHSPVTTSVFVSRLVEAERVRKTTPVPAPPSPTSMQTQTFAASGFQEFLPSSKQVGDALKAVATVAIIALYFLALSAGESANSHHEAAPVLFSSPPSFTRPAESATDLHSRDRVVVQRSIEPLAEVERLPNERTVTNPSTGVRYLFDGDRIKGSDGSRFRVVGSTLYSDSGQSYQVVGEKFVYASDGRSCTLIGDKIYCK